MKTVIRKTCMTISLILMLFWAIMSIYGAFKGAEQAKSFFNTAPMSVFWSILLIMLLAGFLAYPVLKKRTSLMMLHIGCCLVVAGGMLGSEKGHLLVSQLKSEASLVKGFMALSEGQSSARIAPGTESGQPFELPFTIQLVQAEIEYHDNPAILVQFRNAEPIRIPAKEGLKYSISDEMGVISIAKTYKNLKIRQENRQMVPFDDPSPGTNPAYELVLIKPDGTVESQLVFELFPMHRMANSTFYAEYSPPQMVKDYKSTLQVIGKDQQVLKEQTIEVNKPLYYGGYHFYQNTFGYNENGPITGLMVTSAKGVWIVFTGYGLIFIGMIIHFWFGVLRRKPAFAKIDDPKMEANHVD